MSQLDLVLQQSLLASFVAFAEKVQSCPYVSSEVKSKLRTILECELDQIRVPKRAEKYSLSQNKLVLLQEQQSALFMQETLGHVKHFLKTQFNLQGAAQA